MSNSVYPTLPGLTFESTRTVLPPPVIKRKTPSRREYRARDASVTLYGYSLKYEFLRASAAAQDLQTLVGFFNSMGGSFDTFLFLDPDDSVAAGQAFGIGDGTTTAWQLLRSFGAFAEPVQATKGQITVTLNGGSSLNMLQQGAAFDQSPWFGPATVTANSTANPLTGGVDADTLTDTSTVSVLARQQGVTLNVDAADTTTYTASVYVQKTSGGTSRTFRMLLQFDTGGTTATFDMRVNTDTGAVLSSNGGGQASIVDAGSGFWRLILTGANNGTGNTRLLFNLYPAYAPYGVVNADPTITGSAVVYGAKVEPGATVGGFTSRYYTWDAMTGVATISPAPTAGDVLTWSGQFYRRCRFSGDKLDTSKFAYQLFTAGKVDFEMVLV